MRRNIIPYDHSLKEKARELRNKSTFTEVMLWQQLKKKQLLGHDFHRQKPIGHYIVDFYCNELNLAIEVDGESHYGNEEYDLKRQTEIEKFGVRFLRFDDLEVRHNLDGVVKLIRDWIVVNASPPTPRLPRKRDGLSKEGINSPE
jgi:very-short-patch-repair endonuclease